MGMGRVTDAEEAIVYYRDDANRPTLEKAQWVLDEIGLHRLQPVFEQIPGSRKNSSLLSAKISMIKPLVLNPFFLPILVLASTVSEAQDRTAAMNY